MSKSNIYKVEEIRGHFIAVDPVTIEKQYFYLVKWENYPDQQSTWESAKNILDPKLIEDYYKRGGWTWQYYVEADTRYQKAGWYKCWNSVHIESEFLRNEPRTISSRTFTDNLSAMKWYEIDFDSMTQTNVDTKVVRHLRRIHA
jgi:hypothetical protein